MPDTYILTVDDHPLVVNVKLELQAWDYVPQGPPTGTADFSPADFNATDFKTT